MLRHAWDHATFNSSRAVIRTKQKLVFTGYLTSHKSLLTYFEILNKHEFCARGFLKQNLSMFEWTIPLLDKLLN